MTNGFVRSLATLLLLTAFAVDTRAQAVYGSIAGTVSDPSGALLPGVTVTITSVERKTSDTVVTNETGHYVKERLLPGTYEVKIELSGFKQAVYPNIRVNVDTQTTLDFKLAGRRSQRSRDGRRGSHPSSRPTAPTCRRASTPRNSPSCRCSTGTSRSSSC